MPREAGSPSQLLHSWDRLLAAEHPAAGSSSPGRGRARMALLPAVLLVAAGTALALLLVRCRGVCHLLPSAVRARVQSLHGLGRQATQRHERGEDAYAMTAPSPSDVSLQKPLLAVQRERGLDEGSTCSGCGGAASGGGAACGLPSLQGRGAIRCTRAKTCCRLAAGIGWYNRRVCQIVMMPPTLTRPHGL